MKTAIAFLFLVVSTMAFADDPLRAIRQDPLRSVKSACPCGCGCASCGCQAGEPCPCGCLQWFEDGDGWALFASKKQIGYLSPSGTYWTLKQRNGRDEWGVSKEPPIPCPAKKKDSYNLPPVKWVQQTAAPVCRT